MTTRIRDIQIEQRRLDPAEAELMVAVEVEGWGPGTEIRGRWVGPHCEGRSTVEVAYPLQPLTPTPPFSRDPKGSAPLRVAAKRCFRVIIPDPAMWEAASPLLYRGTIELWEGGQRVERRFIEHGLRIMR